MGLLGKILGLRDKVMPVSVNDENFEAEVLRSELPVVLDVWGPSCIHCRKLEPIIIEIATDYRGRLKVAEMNAAAAPGAARRLGVLGTPTVIYFRAGREIERVVGFRGSLYHRDLIDSEILAEPPPPSS